MLLYDVFVVHTVVTVVKSCNSLLCILKINLTACKRKNKRLLEWSRADPGFKPYFTSTSVNTYIRFVASRVRGMYASRVLYRRRRNSQSHQNWSTPTFFSPAFAIPCGPSGAKCVRQPHPEERRTQVEQQGPSFITVSRVEASKATPKPINSRVRTNASTRRVHKEAKLAEK